MNRAHNSGRPAQDGHARVACAVEFRFYEELNDFLPAGKRRQAFTHCVFGTPSVKDTIEALGVPHTEVDVILVNGRSVEFSHLLRGGERVAVYPTFERLDVSPLTRLRPRPLRVTRFIADVHLGTLARYLRLLGFDTLWRNDFDDETIIDLALDERRIILTRDRGILRNGRVTHGYWLRASDPMAQVEEVVRALDLSSSLRPYARCLECNGEIDGIEPQQAAGAVPLQVLVAFNDFSRCRQCGRVYWAGSHKKRLEEVIDRARTVRAAHAVAAARGNNR